MLVLCNLSHNLILIIEAGRITGQSKAVSWGITVEVPGIYIFEDVEISWVSRHEMPASPSMNLVISIEPTI
jgi:hypothetical protein